MTAHENKTHKGWLMSGAGNTFAIEITEPEKTLNNVQAKEICSHFKVDGYLGISKNNKNEFVWNFFNSDGSDAEFCGNAARCAQDFLHKQASSKQSKHLTTAGLVLSWTEENKNWVKMPNPKILDALKKIEIDGQIWNGFWCNTGVPHFVLMQPKLRHDVWLQTSKKLRNHSDFGPRGSNITWMQKLESKTNAVTYERGVEDFTQACGTGAFAAALCWQSLERERKIFEIAMPGGQLSVVFHEMGWMMTGPVEKLGDWSLS